ATPPSSPGGRNTPPKNIPPSKQKQQADKKNAKENAKCYRENKQLAKEIKHLKKKAQLYKQRWFREKQSKKKQGFAEKEDTTVVETLF
ncbi:MAG: hypothetical protein ABW185_17930, partial [Sedimenticola sp.]